MISDDINIIQWSNRNQVRKVNGENRFSFDTTLNELEKLMEGQHNLNELGKL